MNGIQHFETFLIAGILLNLTPGSDTIFILTRSIAQGRRAGIASVLGIAAGSVVHTVLASAGLSVLISQSLVLFTALKFAGAAYLVFLGVQTMRSRASLGEDNPDLPREVDQRRVFRDAMLTNVLNPKVALFFIAFLPQFIRPGAAMPGVSFLILGLTFCLTGTAWCLVLAFGAAAISRRLRESPRAAKALRLGSGLALVGLGVKVATAGAK
jgi:RhtB (resistance to homoserine/threonine) family protein